MSDNINAAPISDDIEVVGPGQMLKEARIELGLSQQDVAKQLNLRETAINDIEHDIFDEKIPVTFIRGYLKNYARFVGVSYNDVKIAYETIDVAKLNSGEMKSFSQNTRKKAENNRLMFVIYFMIFVLIGLTVVWWIQESSKSDLDNQESSIATTSTQNTVESEQQTHSVKSTTEIRETNTVEASADVKDVVANVGNDLDDLVTDVNDVTKTVSANTNIAKDKVTKKLSEQSPLTLDSLTFSFSGDCWVNIFDATGERLAWGIKKADYVMSLQGKAPFTITLGKPELVNIDFNQETVDMTQFQKGQIAKFTWPKQ